MTTISVTALPLPIGDSGKHPSLAQKANFITSNNPDDSPTPPSTASSSSTTLSTNFNSNSSSSQVSTDDSQPNTPLFDELDLNTNGDGSDGNTATVANSVGGGMLTDDENDDVLTDDQSYNDDDDGQQTDDDDEDNQSSTLSAPLSPLRLTSDETAAGISICAKNNMKVDQFNYGKSKDGKAGNALRAHNTIMTLMQSAIEGRPDTVSVSYPPYIGKKRDNGEQDTTEHPTENLFFKIGTKVHEYNAVRNSWLRAGFVRTNSWSKASAYWGQHCSAQAFRNLNKYQKVNHFPGSWCIGNKARLGKIMGRMRRMYGKDFHIHAETLCMPMDRRKLANLITAEPRALWIIKPSNSSCGRGIRVTSSQSLNPKKLHKGTIVQRYLANPYLIGGRKFDMRIYVVVTSYDPLRAYLCEEGLVRFATGKYSKSLKSLKNRFVHLTNYSVNKNSDEFVKPTSNAEGNGVADIESASKWTLTQLKSYFRDRDIDDVKVMDDIKDCCVKTLIAAEPHIASMCHQLQLCRSNCFEVFGFDVFLDNKLKPWLIEVNVSPSLSSSSPLDKRIKNKLLCDVFHLVGFQPFNHREEERKSEEKGVNRLHRGGSSSKKRAKSASTLKRRNVLKLSPGKMKSLSPDDMDIVAEMEDEYTRRADMERIYPSDDPQTNDYYAQFFEAQRYNNTLVNLWIAQHGVDGLIRAKKEGSGGRGPRRPFGQRSQSSSRPKRMTGEEGNRNRPTLVERQSLRRNQHSRQALAAKRLQEYKEMNARLEGRDRGDRDWDRDWDAAHGHGTNDDYDDDNDYYIDDGEVEQQNVVDYGHRHVSGSAAATVTALSSEQTVNGVPLSPRTSKARAILNSAQSDFDGELRLGLLCIILCFVPYPFVLRSILVFG